MRYYGFKALMAAFIFVALVSCSKDGETGIDQSDKGHISYLPIKDCHVHPLGDDLYFSYTSGEPWELSFVDDKGSTSQPSWIEVETVKGKSGTTQIHMTVESWYDETTELGSRSCKFSFTDNYGNSKDSFTIYQKKAVIKVSKDEITMEWKKGNAEFTVESNVEWKADFEGKNKWFSESGNLFGKVSGQLKDDFSMAAKPVEVKLQTNGHNVGEDTKNATIKVVPVKGGEEVKNTTIEKTVSLSQNQLMFYFVDEEGNSLDDGVLDGFDELGYDFLETADKSYYKNRKDSCRRTLKVRLDKNYQFKTDFSNQEGISVEEKSVKDYDKDGRSLDEYSYDVTWNSPNPSTDKEVERTLTMWLEDGGTKIEGTERTIKLVQDKYVFKLADGKTEYRKEDFANTGESDSFALVTTGPWELRDSKNKPVKNLSALPDQWLKLTDQSYESKLNGDGNQTVMVVVEDQNLCFEDDNTHNFTGYSICSTLNDLSIPLTVKQEPFKFEASFDDGSDTKVIPRWGRNEDKVKITSSGPWRIEIEEDWLSPETEDGDSGAAEVVLAAEEYNDLSIDGERTAEIKVVSVAHEVGGKPFDCKLTFKQESLRVNLKEVNDRNKDWEPEVWEAYKGDKSGNELNNDQEFYMNISAPWTFEADSDSKWIKLYRKTDGQEISGDDGRNNYIYCVRVGPNAGKDKRTGSFQIVADLGGSQMPLRYDVEQNGFEFIVSDKDGNPIKGDTSYDVAVVNSDEYPFDIFATGNAPVAVSVSDSAEMLSKDNEDIGYGKFQWKVQPTDNVSNTKTRSSTVTFSSEISGESVTVKFSQGKYHWKPSAFSPDWPEEEIDELAEDTYTMAMQSSQKPCLEPSLIDNLDYEISENESSPISFILKIMTKKNYSTKPNQMKFKIVSYKNKFYTNDYTINQRGYHFKVQAVGLDGVTFGPLEDIDKKITAYCSEDIQTDGMSGLITLDEPQSQTDNLRDIERIINIAAVPKNYSNEPQEYSFLIHSISSHMNKEELEKKITFKRSRYEFDTSVLPENGSTTDIPAAPAPTTYKIKCSGELMSENASVSDNGDGTWTLTVSLPENKSESPVSTTVKVFTADSKIYTAAEWQVHTFTLNQAAAEKAE